MRPNVIVYPQVINTYHGDFGQLQIYSELKK